MEFIKGKEVSRQYAYRRLGDLFPEHKTVFYMEARRGIPCLVNPTEDEVKDLLNTHLPFNIIIT